MSYQKLESFWTSTPLKAMYYPLDSISVAVNHETHQALGMRIICKGLPGDRKWEAVSGKCRETTKTDGIGI